MTGLEKLYNIVLKEQMFLIIPYTLGIASVITIWWSMTRLVWMNYGGLSWMLTDSS